jgi:dTDP-4-dehydrorhamnose 3,5-epimerase
MPTDARINSVTEPMPGVLVKPLNKYSDQRGWLMEVFRDDELPEGFEPAMSYLSVTKPGVARGPHEHVHQTDLFVFLDGAYELHLWDSRNPGGEPVPMAAMGSFESVDLGPQEPYLMLQVGAENPVAVFVPPGVVHAYRNVGDKDAFVLNYPDKLYAGHGKKEPVDEIRHEEREDAKYRLP